MAIEERRLTDYERAEKINSDIVQAKQRVYQAKVSIGALQHSEAREAMVRTIEEIYKLFDKLQ